MPKIFAGGIEIQYQEEGTGFALILIHGLSGDLSAWSLVMPKLSKQYRTIALDVRGHGNSSKPDEPYSIQGFSDDLAAFLDELQISRAHILGLSMGGAIAQQFALDHGARVRSLILVSTFSHIDGEGSRFLKRMGQHLDQGDYGAFFDEIVRRSFTPAFVGAYPRLIEELKEKRIQVNSPAAIGRAVEACMAFDRREEIGRIAAPTLVISGREDRLTPTHLAEQIHRSIRGSEWKILEGAGHNLYLEQAPQLVRGVLDFLQRH